MCVCVCVWNTEVHDGTYIYVQCVVFYLWQGTNERETERENMPRNRKKGGKGGNRTFAYSADDIKKADDRAQKKREARAERRKGCDSDSDSGSDSGSDSDNEDRVTIEQMRAMASASKPKEYKPKGSASVLGDEIQNLNKGRKNNVKMKDLNSLAKEKAPMSRREREAAEKERKKREYMERHMRGETEQARKDLERLKLIRARRAREAQRKKEEAEAAKRKQQKKKEESGSDEENAYEDLTSREIKKMNPSKLKEELKLRDQPIQGNKKALQKRLLDWCKENQKST